jgi:hypothetical protein
MSQRADGDESIHLTDGLIREKADASLQNCFSTHIYRFVSLFFLTVDTSGSLLFVGFLHPPSLFRQRDVNPSLSLHCLGIKLKIPVLPFAHTDSIPSS